ncbi:hypothetical protein LCGC14_0442580 [marine sediment metagenome]|uniref:Macro domain-containing protein n=1 Tax=marine sediment metagenome TaxID=412755 RepID=A0A0F9VU59_9ZZZZ
MKEVNSNLWDSNADIIVITTNGATRKDGAAIMGRGVALQAKQRYPGIEHVLGRLIRENGNHVSLITGNIPKIVSFPVKHHWRERADLKLINQSVIELVQLVDRGTSFFQKYLTVALPRPGCGNGRLRWEEVRSIIRLILDDRFTIYNND